MIRETIRKLTHRKYKSADDLYRRRTKYGEINEFFKRQIIPSDRLKYGLPFFGNPFREGVEKSRWQESESTHYEYFDPARRQVAEKRFQFMFDMVKDRIGKDYFIFDVGCNTGFYLDQWKTRGFDNLYGIDPQKIAVEYAREHRPHLKITEGFFGPKKNDIECDLMVCFGSIHRVPYYERMFEAIDRSVNEYVLVWLQESLDDFHRDFHVGLGKKGFICIDKRVVSKEFVPIGHEGARGDMIILEENETQKNFDSHFLFRRVSPRPLRKS